VERGRRRWGGKYECLKGIFRIPHFAQALSSAMTGQMPQRAIGNNVSRLAEYTAQWK